MGGGRNGLGSGGFGVGVPDMNGGHSGCERGGVKVGGYSGYQDRGVADQGVPGVPGMELGVPDSRGWGLWMSGICGSSRGGKRGRGELLWVPGRDGGSPESWIWGRCG